MVSRKQAYCKRLRQDYIDNRYDIINDNCILLMSKQYRYHAEIYPTFEMYARRFYRDFIFVWQSKERSELIMQDVNELSENFIKLSIKEYNKRNGII